VTSKIRADLKNWFLVFKERQADISWQFNIAIQKGKSAV
jgi:hypothetical protein